MRRSQPDPVTRATTLAAFLAAAVAAPTATAQVIDFETTPDGSTPVDDVPLDRTAAYIVDGVGVRMGFDTNGDGIADQDAVFERRGTDAVNGYTCQFGAGGHDIERPGSPEQLGMFFLRQSDGGGTLEGSLVIDYDAPITELRGQIWDIDRRLDTLQFERWRVVALDEAGIELAERFSPEAFIPSHPESLDSLAWVFTFQGVGEIRTVVIEYVGTAPTVGLAFDNFSPTSAIALGIVEQPVGVVLDQPGGQARFGVMALGPGELAYQWRRDGAPLSDGPGVSGATTTGLTIDAGPADIGVYDVVVSNDFGEVTSDPAVLAIRASACPADFDGDGSLTIFDFLAFQNAFDAGCP